VVGRCSYSALHQFICQAITVPKNTIEPSGKVLHCRHSDESRSPEMQQKLDSGFHQNDDCIRFLIINTLLQRVLHLNQQSASFYFGLVQA
jgi:hypothetical protein